MLTINVVSNTLVTFENLFYSSWLSQSRERAIFNELGHLLFQFNQHAAIINEIEPNRIPRNTISSMIESNNKNGMTSF